MHTEFDTYGQVIWESPLITDTGSCTSVQIQASPLAHWCWACTELTSFTQNPRAAINKAVSSHSSSLTYSSFDQSLKPQTTRCWPGQQVYLLIETFSLQGLFEKVTWNTKWPYTLSHGKLCDVTQPPAFLEILIEIQETWWTMWVILDFWGFFTWWQT